MYGMHTCYPHLCLLLQVLQSNNRAFLIRVSYLEIYNEKVHDLLATDSDKEAKIVLNPKNNNVSTFKARVSVATCFTQLT